jgi:hypothetical protein
MGSTARSSADEDVPTVSLDARAEVERVPVRDPWVLAVVATRASVRLTAEITLPRSWPPVAVVEEWVQVERPERSEDERPGGAPRRR